MNLIGQHAFGWFLTVCTLIGSIWALYDVWLLWKLRGGDAKDPVVRDQRFGYAIGIVIGGLALYGTLHFHGVV